MTAPITRLAPFFASLFILFANRAYGADARTAGAKPYVNIGVGLIDGQDRTDFNGVLSGVFRGGVELSPYFALEAEGQIGLGQKTSETIFSNVRFDETRVKLNHQFGAYAVGKLPLSEAASLQARAGYAAYQSTATTDQFFEGALVNNFEDTINLSGASLGLGGEYMFGADQLNGIRMEGSILINVDDSLGEENSLPDINSAMGFSVSYLRKF